MKCFTTIRASLVSAVLVFAGCSSSPMSRIDANRATYESWPIEVQSAVLEGRATKDMTPEMVRVALGEPTRIEPRVGSTTNEETWIYEKGGGLNVPRPNISLGGMVGGVGVRSGGIGGRSAQTQRSAEEHTVVFQNGVVTRVD